MLTPLFISLRPTKYSIIILTNIAITIPLLILEIINIIPELPNKEQILPVNAKNKDKI